MKAFLVVIAVLLICAPAMAGYYVAGDFNTWNAAGNAMTETAPGSGVWSVSLTGLVAGSRHEYKVTNGTWNENWPWSGNSWFIADETGGITLTYDSTTHADGWVNASKRLGVSSAPTTWTAVGSWQGWSNSNPATALTPIGDGVYYCQADLPVGSYVYKAVVTGTWDAIGKDARGINSDPLEFNVIPGSTQWGFWVDALKGTIKARSLPESPVSVDGLAIPADFNGLLRATQTNPTGFNDNTGDSGGSELDGLYVARGINDGRDGLYIGVTGNLETNGNAYVILLDTNAAAGTGTLAPYPAPDALAGFSGAVVDSGFTPDWAICVNNAGGTTYVDLTDLDWASVSPFNFYLGCSKMDSGVGNLTGGAVTNHTVVSFNNKNHAGVTSDATRSAAANQSDAATATKGLEMHIPFEDLYISNPSSLGSVGIMVILCKGDGVNGSYVSNQTLPGLGGGYLGADMPRGGTSLDFAGFPGDQYATVSLATSLMTPVAIDGDNIPTDIAIGPAALQNNQTDWGDKLRERGSELDQLFIGQDANSLLIGATGNLWINGDFWLLFIQSGTGGSNVLNVPAGVGPQSGALQALNGTTFDSGFAPTHVLCINNGGGNCNVDLVDLVKGTSRYLGMSGLDGGSGVLGADNPLAVQVAFNNSNVLGVTDITASGAGTAATGAEIYLPFSCLGATPGATSVKVMAWLVSNLGDSLSNQVLPGLPAGTANPTGPANFQTIAGDQFVTVPVTVPAIASVAKVGEAKSQPNGKGVHMRARVSASFADGTFYVQDKGAPTGLQVSWRNPTPAAGSLVDIDGYMSTGLGYGMRSVDAYNVATVEEPLDTFINPFGMGTEALGGATMGANPGVTGSTGVNNIGSLVTIWGVVTDYMTIPGAFYVDDGKGLSDGAIEGVKGVRVIGDPYVAGVWNGANVSLTGISTIWVEYPANAPRVNHRAVRLVGSPVFYYTY